MAAVHLRNFESPAGAARPVFIFLALLCALLGAAPAPAAVRGAAPRIAAPPVSAAPVSAPRIAAAPKTHPRLFLGPGAEAGLKAKIAADPLLTQVYQRLTSTADDAQKLQPVVYRKDGRRLLGRSREALKRLTHLALLARLTGQARYVDAAKREMLSAAAFKDWNPSHFLDVAEMTAALGIGYDWLYNQLDPASRATIRKAIVEKGLNISFTAKWPVKGTNNWGQVCHGGLVIGALAVMEDEPELAARVIDRAVQNIHFPMTAYKPDGTYPEGPGYWGYGTTFNVLLVEALATALGSDCEISKAPGFMQTADYYLHAHGPTGMSFNYSDGGARTEVEPAMFWFAARLKRPSLLWNERQKLQTALKRSARAAGSGDRILPFLTIWAEGLSQVAPPTELCRQGGGETAIAMLRGGWGPNDVYVGFKGGSPSASHGHMDIGSFVMDAGGVRWAMDLGMQDYNSLETRGIGLWDGKQTGQRWSVFRLNNFAHGTLVVDGQLQRIAGFAKMTRFVPDSSMPHAVLDMTPVYQGQLARATRGIELLNGKAVMIQDELQGTPKPAEVRWAMVTPAEVKLDGARATLTQEGKKLELRVLEPKDAQLETYSTNPPAAYDAKNPGTRMVGFKVKLGAAESKRLIVTLSPGATTGKTPELKPLAEW